jgi:hypothetical protein
MALGHKNGRRPGRRAFRPTLDGRLEDRMLLTATAIKAHTAAGGQAVVITSTTGQQFYVSVTTGTIQATPASGCRVNLIAKGTTSNTFLEINQIIPMHSLSAGAHTFNASLGNHTGVLNIASIDITSGFINSIEGYHDAILSGPLTATGTSAVNRIAFLSIDAGGSINVGGDLDTLDVSNSADFSGSIGLNVGQDLNWFEVGGDLTIENGANMVVGREIGTTGQAAKGSGLAGQGLFVNGNLTIGTGSVIAVGRAIGPFGLLINGNASGLSRLFVNGVPLPDLTFEPATMQFLNPVGNQPFNFLALGSVSL